MHVALANGCGRPPAFAPEAFCRWRRHPPSPPACRLAIQARCATLLEEHHASLDEETHPFSREAGSMRERSLLKSRRTR